MVAFKRFASSRGFILDTDLPQDPNLLTLYIPAADPKEDTISSISTALKKSSNNADKSFFLQLLKLDKSTEDLIQDINAAIAYIEKSSGRFAFLLWNNAATLGFRRDHQWKQVGGRIDLAHLAFSKINTYRDKNIVIDTSLEPTLVFKEIKLSLAGNHIVYREGTRRFRTIDLLLDLRRGIFHFNGISKIKLFADSAISQTLYRGDYVEGDPNADVFGLRSTRDMIQIFEPQAIETLQSQNDQLGFHVHGELDLFPYDKVSWCLRSASNEIQKRSKIELIKPAGTLNSHIDLPVNQHDTLGNTIHLQVGKTGQSLRFVMAPKQLFQERKTLDVIEPSYGTAGIGTAIIPEGLFPISPITGSSIADSNRQTRRLKLGISNTEVVSVDESNEPSAGYQFIGEASTDGIPFSTSVNKQPAYLRRSILDFSDELQLNDEEIENYRLGELLSTSVPTIWAHIVPVGLDRQNISQAQAATEHGWQVSSQADELAQFSYSQNTALNSNSKVLDYQLDDEPEVRIDALKVIFVNGLGSGTSFNDPSSERRINDPLLLHNETLARYRLQQRTKLMSNIVRLRGNNGHSVTPQGFELERKADKEMMSLAKSINVENEEKKFSITFKFDGFRNLMRQNQFFLVVPTKYADISSGSNSKLFDLNKDIQISDWGFSLDLPSEGSTNSTLDLSSSTVRAPILVFKYKKGTLRTLLTNRETWDNYSQENLFPSDKVQSTEATIKTWIKEIDENSPRPNINREQGKSDYFRIIRDILDNPDWVGTLVIYPQVDLDNMPEGLAGLASGMELDRFRAHHIGFSQNKVNQEGGIPSIQPSSFFGLVDYNDNAAPEQDFSFKVHELKVLFGNSEVKGFDCLLKVKLAKWFGEGSTLDNGGAVPHGHSPNSDKTLWIRGRYESLITESGQKINKYSFIHDQPIHLIDRPDQEPDDYDGEFFQKLTINYLEFRTLKSKQQSDGKREVSSKIIIDANAKFKNLSLPGISDVVNFESIEMNGLALDFSGLFQKFDGTWQAIDTSNFWPNDLNFDGIAIDASFPKLRPGGLFDNFPLKFKKFHLFDSLSLPKIGYSNFGGDKGDEIRFGLQFRLDIGSLGRLIGFDSSLVADLLVGWNPGDRPGFAVGLRFPDNGGRRLDLSLGPVKFTAGYFDMFESISGNNRFIALTDFRMDINGFKLPPDNVNSGILLTPAPDDPNSNERKHSYFESMGWLAGFSAKKVAFLDKLILFVSQNYKYIGPTDSAKDVVNRIEDIITLNLGPDKDKWQEESLKFRRKIDGHLRYNSDYEWFIGAGATFADSIVEGYAVYNPPGLYGGEGTVKDLLSLSIMYQQTTPRLGVYTGTLKFADKIRRFSVGAVTIQLPWVVMKMDTDGGYLINVGLNLSDLTDYSNAAAAEFGVFTGSAGVAYGKIGGSALRDVPLLRKQITGAETALPVYTPITRLTLSGKFGIGRSIDEWPMFRGGSHVSVYGILSGTWGKFSPIELNGRVNQEIINEIRSLLPNHYHKYWAELGILAEIWGVIDFSVTRFSVNARALIGYGVSFETLRGTNAYARALISVSIRWVLFRIRVFGKKIEVSIRLRFSQEFRKTYVLARPKTNVPYDKYFTTLAGIQSLQTIDINELEDLKPRQPMIFHLDQQPTISKQKLIKVLPLFDYVRNDTGNIVAVPVLNIPYGNVSDSGELDTGQFKDILDFVIDWSFNGLKIEELVSDGIDHLQPGRLSKSKIMDCALAIATLRLRGNRMEWSAVRVKHHLNTAFSFDYIDPDSLPEEFEQETRGATVFFTTHAMEAISISLDGTETQISNFANRELPGTFIERLDQIFDRRRVQVQDDDKTIDSLQDLDSGTSKLLEDYLLEEYLESILKAVWALLSEKLPDTDLSEGLTLLELKQKMLKEAEGVSMRVNRQFFSGNRVPADAMDMSGNNFNVQTQSTYPMPSARSIEIEIDPGALPKGLALKFGQSRIDFLTDMNAAQAIRELRDLPINFGPVSAKHKSPFIKGPHEGLPLTEQVPVNLQQGDSFKLHILPDNLKTKTVYRLDPYREGNHDNSRTISSVSFRQAALIRVPLIPIEGAADLYQIDRMPEDSRRILGLMQRENIDFGNLGINLSFLRSRGDNNEAFNEISLDLSKSFILRTNLSTDPNPTQFSISTLEQYEIPVRAGFQPIERNNAFSILTDASETNSGGYMIRLKGFEESDIQELTILIVLPDQQQQSTLPIYVRALVANASSGNISGEAPLMLREIGQKVIALGTPGVVELEVKRPNPENLFSSRNVPGLHISREEALREILQGTSDLINNQVDSESFLYSNHAEQLLQYYGVDQVNLSSRYNLLAVSIEENDYYEHRPADRDLPVTPLVDDDAESVSDSQNWVYSWSVSASRFVNNRYARSRELIQDKDYHFLYGAIGTNMMITTQFRDIMGYNAPSGHKTTTLKPRYYDPLIAPGSLEGIKSSHNIENKKFIYSLTFDGAQSTPDLDVQNLSLAERNENLENRATAIMRCMQQIRDKGTTYKLHSTLGFSTGTSKSLSIANRKRIYDFLKKCYNAVRGQKTSFSDSLKLEFALTGKVPAKGYSLYHADLVISRDINDVDDRIAQSQGKHKIKSEVIEKQINLPLADKESANTSTNNAPSKEQRLAEAVKAFTTNNGNQKIIAAYSENAHGETLIYILDAKVFELTPSRSSNDETAAYAAFEPIATQAKSEVGASYWNWAKRKQAPQPNSSFEKVTISDFDMDTAFSGLLQDIDLFNAPDQLAPFLKDTETTSLIERLAKARARLAEKLAMRHAAIYDKPDDETQIIEAKKVLIDNLSNSLKRKISRFYEVDTILIVPLNYRNLSIEDDKILLYGIVGQNIANQTNDSRSMQEGNFFPAAFRRNGNKGNLCIQYDVANAGQSRLVKSPLCFNIEYVRLNLGSGEVSSIDADNTRWLKLFEPREVNLTQANQPANVPVLFKSLIKSPIVSVQESPDQDVGIARALGHLKDWSLIVDVERKDQVAQDDTFIDIDYNTRSQQPQVALDINRRSILSVLSEYNDLSGKRAAPDDNPGLSDVLWLRALVYWTETLQFIFSSGNNISALNPTGFETVQQHYSLRTHNALQTVNTDYSSTSLLKKVGDWDSKDLTFSLKRINPDKSIHEGVSDNGGDDLARVRSKYNPELRYQGNRLSIGGLNLMLLENAWPSVWVQRNQGLSGIEDLATNNKFVYTSNKIRTGDRYTPSVKVIAGAIHGPSLKDALFSFLEGKVFDDLIALNLNQTSELWPTIDLMWSYESGVLDALKSKHPETAIFQPEPIARSTAIKTGPDLMSIAESVHDSVVTWLSKNPGAVGHGYVEIRMTIFSRLLETQKQLLRIEKIRFPL